MKLVPEVDLWSKTVFEYETVFTFCYILSRAELRRQKG